MNAIAHDSTGLEDFEVLEERADECGRRWAARIIERTLQDGKVPSFVWVAPTWQAQALVDVFAPDTVGLERKRLGDLVQRAAAEAWHGWMIAAAESLPMAAE